MLNNDKKNVMYIISTVLSELYASYLCGIVDFVNVHCVYNPTEKLQLITFIYCIILYYKGHPMQSICWCLSNSP